MRHPRGFSLLLVLLALVVMSVVGLVAFRIGQTELGVATSRGAQRQAMAAAEAGLAHFLGNAPSGIKTGVYYLGSETTHVYLPDTTGADGRTVRSRYRVHTTVAGPVTDSAIVLSEGEALVGGSVVGRALVSAVVSATAASGNRLVYPGQKSLGAWGTSTNLPARSDIGLVDLP
jgi:type II secretory pathway pseudopilin PulG